MILREDWVKSVLTLMMTVMFMVVKAVSAGPPAEAEPARTNPTVGGEHDLSVYEPPYPDTDSTIFGAVRTHGVWGTDPELPFFALGAP